MSNQSIVLLLSDARGTYIPRDFVEEFNMVDWNVTEEQAEGCKNCENEWYWESWETILNNAFYIDKKGNKFSLHQDGDLWAICYDRMTEEEKENFGFED